MKILLLILSLFAASLVTSQAQDGNCDTHTKDKEDKGSGI